MQEIIDFIKPTRGPASDAMDARRASIADKPIVPHTLLLADDSVTIQRVIELTFADEDIARRRGQRRRPGDRSASTPTPPDIVLADIGMPGTNGYEVAQHIQQYARGWRTFRSCC